MKNDNYQNVVALRLAEDAAKIGADLLLSRQGKRQKMVLNSAGNYCTETELRVQEEVIQKIALRFPNHHFVTEESEFDSQWLDQSRPVWILDPLDGSTNYIHGYPHFCISLALFVKGSIQICVIIDPMRDEIFTAMKGAGAKLNGFAIRVDNSLTLQDGLLASCTHSYPEQDFELNNIEVYRELYTKGAAIRRSGSFALDLAYSACNRVNGFWGHGQNIWDLAAGLLLAVEAGAIATSYTGEGRDWYLQNKTIVSANQVCHRELQALIEANMHAVDRHDGDE